MSSRSDTKRDDADGRERGPSRVLVLMVPAVHALDFAGPVQAIYEANGFGARYDLRYVGQWREVRSAQGVLFGGIEPLPEIEPRDWVVIPGLDSKRLDGMRVPVGWIRRATATARRVSSICSGGFLLARAGVLEGKACTTHWKMIPLLREWSPGSRVLENRLFVRDGNIVTSAGLASGIDLTLACLQEDWGARVAAKVAREMVVYVRRNGETEQESVYLQHRDHVHPGVHRVQDWIVEHPDERPTLDTLAEIAAVSPRHLTRLFREATGITLVAFAHKVKLEVARALAENPALTMDAIAARCGFGDARHLRRLWRAENGTTIGRRRAAGRPPENSTLRDLEGRQR